MFLVKVFTEGKKVVGKAFFPKKKVCTKRVTYRYPIRVLEKLIAETEKRQPQDPADYFLNGLKRSRIKYGCNRKLL